jgi:hypothetical protein
MSVEALAILSLGMAKSCLMKRFFLSFLPSETSDTLNGLPEKG